MNWKWITAIFVCVFALWLASTPIVLWQSDRCLDFSEAGMIGDSFGAVNALFSGLAFAGVIIALTLQRQEFHKEHAANSSMMEMQAIELEIQRQAQKDSQAVLEKQVELLRSSAVIQATTALAQAYGANLPLGVLTEQLIKSDDDLEAYVMGSNHPPAHCALHIRQLERLLTAAKSLELKPGETE